MGSRSKRDTTAIVSKASLTFCGTVKTKTADGPPVKKVKVEAAAKQQRPQPAPSAAPAQEVPTVQPADRDDELEHVSRVQPATSWTDSQTLGLEDGAADESSDKRGIISPHMLNRNPG